MDENVSTNKKQIGGNKFRERPNFAETGKLPPQALELEEAVLGALMLEKGAVGEVAEILKIESFYKDVHQKIYAAIIELFNNTEPIDILTVVQQLRKMGNLEIVGGAGFISQLTNKVASSANIEYHARIIAQKHVQRELITVSSNIAKKAYEDSADVFDLIDEAERGLFSISEGAFKKNFDNLKDVLRDAIAKIEENSKKDLNGITGIPTGFNKLDSITAGWQPSDLIIVAARPAMGKTAFVLSMARNVAVDFKRPIAIFSLEMASVQLVNRLIASETGISSETIRKGNLQDHEFVQLHTQIAKLAEAPMFIDDTAGLSVFEFRAKCRRLVHQHKVEIVVIDYLQLMNAGGEGGGNRVMEVGIISRTLKIVAKDLNIPIIALSQLNRSVEQRPDKRPMISDLRDSGSIEQDADIVSFLYRPEYYGLMTDEEGNSTENEGQLIVSKHRNGETGVVKMKFVKHLAKFINMEKDNFLPSGGGGASKPGDGNFDAFAGIEPPEDDDFDNYSPVQTIKMQSKMNQSDDTFFNETKSDDDAPF